MRTEKKKPRDKWKRPIESQKARNPRSKSAPAESRAKSQSQSRRAAESAPVFILHFQMIHK